MKPKYKKYLAICLIVLFALVIFFNVNQTTKTFTYNDKTLGLVTYKITEYKFIPLDKISPLAIIYTPNMATATVGQTLTIKELFGLTLSCSSVRAQKIILSVMKDGSIVSGQDITSQVGSTTSRCGSNLVASITFSPSQTGSYTAKTDITYTNYNGGWFCKDTKTASDYNGNTYYCPNYGSQTVSGINICANSICSLNNPIQSFTLPPGNTITVTTPQQSCTKSPYFGSWANEYLITGGSVQQRYFFTIDGSCNAVQDHDEERIVCNTGYLVSGTSSTIATFTGSQSCEQQIIDTPVENTTTCECNADLTITCSDNTIVVEKSCYDGCNFVQTGNTCSVVNTNNTNTNNNSNSCTSDLTFPCSNGNTVTLKNCVGGKYVPIIGASCYVNNQNDTDGNSGNNSSTSSTALWSIIISVIVAVAILSGIIIYILRRRK